MTLIGTPPDEWVNLIDTLVPAILNLVISTWEEMPPPASDALEDPTTEALCRCLRQSRTSSTLPFRIDIQSVELDPAADQDQGRMDITFSPMVPDESIYFCLECKRLNVVNDGRTRTYATEYVTHGMMRFIRGKYSAQVRHGGMLGYVLDGNVEQAIQKVISAIQARHMNLEMKTPGDMLPSSVRQNDSGVRETHHTRQHNSDLFQIHHIFVAGPSNKPHNRNTSFHKVHYRIIQLHTIQYIYMYSNTKGPYSASNKSGMYRLKELNSLLNPSSTSKSRISNYFN